MPCGAVMLPQVEDRGLEPVSPSPLSTTGLQHSVSVRGAECGAVGDCDQDLARLVEAWPRLPAAIKAGILATVTAVQRDGFD